MKQLILDYSKWRCGGYGNNMLGTGRTLLHNNEGCECCLGQFALQLNTELTVVDIDGAGRPNHISEHVPLLNEETDDFLYSTTAFASMAMEINDQEDTTPSQKIEALKELFAPHGYEIIVINQASI